jgi:hypothetical protein
MEISIWPPPPTSTPTLYQVEVSVVSVSAPDTTSIFCKFFIAYWHKPNYQCTLMPVAHTLIEKYSSYFLNLQKVVGEPSLKTHAT